VWLRPRYVLWFGFAGLCVDELCRCQAYTSQYIALLMMALQLSEDRISFTERRNQIIEGLHSMPGMIKKVLEQDKTLQQLANTVSENKSLLLMGRGYQCVSAFFFLLATSDKRGVANILLGMRHVSRVPSKSRRSAICIPKVHNRPRDQLYLI
jgi:hypothetical protein